MKKNLLFVSIIAGLLILGNLVSCKKDAPTPPALTAITLSKDTLKINVGDTKSINITLTPSNFDKTKIVWHSSDNTIVSVDNNGLLTAISEGEAIITVTNQTATITSVCLVSVLPKLKGIAVTKDTVQMNAGDVKSINVTLTPLNSDKSTLVWKSSDTTILSVNSTGIITAKKQGDAIVSVRNQNATLTAFCLVLVAPKIDDLTIALIPYYPFNDSSLDQ